MSEQTVSLKKAKEVTKGNEASAATTKNAKNLKAKVKAKKEREVMYNYGYSDQKNFPNGLESALDKKKFRAMARKRNESFSKKIKKAEGKERTDLIAKADKWAARVYVKGAAPKFG